MDYGRFKASLDDHRRVQGRAKAVSLEIIRFRQTRAVRSGERYDIFEKRE